MNEFEKMKIEFDVILKKIEEVKQEISAIHTAGSTDGKAMDQLSRLNSKLSVLEGRNAEIKAGLPAAEYAVMQSVSDERRAKLDEVGRDLEAEVMRITEQLKPLFDYPSVDPAFVDIVKAAKPVHDLIYAQMRAGNDYNHAMRLETAFALEHGLPRRR